jgi:branched-chain amino acid transport system permease protein
MELEGVLKPLISGLLIGSSYILVALGLTVIFSVMNVLNFAHGEIYMLGAFGVFYLCAGLHMNYIAAFILSVIGTGILGLILQRVFFRPTKGDMLTSVIVAFGLIWLLQTGSQLVFGKQPRSMPDIIPGTVTLLNFNISKARIIAGLICVVLLIIVYIFVYKTRQGKAMQAISQDKEAAALQGIDINKIEPLGFALGCALAGAAGAIMAPILYIEATMGTNVLNTSLSVIVLGGVGSIPGAAIGGLILGIVQSYGQQYLGYVSSIFPFCIIILILLFKRTGLMGRQA